MGDFHDCDDVPGSKSMGFNVPSGCKLSRVVLQCYDYKVLGRSFCIISCSPIGIGHGEFVLTEEFSPSGSCLLVLSQQYFFSKFHFLKANCCTFLVCNAEKEENIWKFHLTNLRSKTGFWGCMFSLEHLQLLTQGSFCLLRGNIIAVLMS